MNEQDGVGYGKPPIKHQFKKGQSGNPSGKPKKRSRWFPDEPLDFRRALIAELTSHITITEGGKKKKITKLQAIAKKLVARALQDDKTAMRLILPSTQALSQDDLFDGGNKVYTYRYTVEQREAMDKLLEQFDQYACLLESGGKQK